MSYILGASFINYRPLKERIIPKMKDFESIIDLFENPRPYQEAQSIVRNTSRHDIWTARQEAVELFSYAIPCVEAIQLMVSLSSLIEVGAGSGHWARLLKKAGAEIVATDVGGQKEYSNKWEDKAFGIVKNLSAVEAIKKYPERNVLVIWPSYDKTWAKEMA